MNIILHLLLTSLLLHLSPVFPSDLQRPIVVVIPSHNNAPWCKKNLTSVFEQQYDNYRIIYIDDCSTDETYKLVRQCVADHNAQTSITIIKNKKRRGALYNHFKAVHLCADNEIVVQLDGDDWFAHENVLSVINDAYKNPQVWLTYGQHKVYPTGEIGMCKPMPEAIIHLHAYREYDWITSAPRTFYAWLFKKIKCEDLLYQADFFTAGGDLACMFPMLEMAAGRIHFIDEVLYIYNCATENNDYKKNLLVQKTSENICRSRKKYEPLISQMHPDENEQVDCIILSNNNPRGLALLLGSIERHCQDFNNVYVFFKQDNEENELAYHRCAQLCSSALFFPLHPIKFKKKLVEIISDKTARYVVLASDELLLTRPINIKRAVSWLQQTHAYAFFFTLGKNTVWSETFECMYKQPDFIELDDDTFAWHLFDAEGDWRHCNNCTVTLYKKSLLKNQLKNITFDSIETFLQRWEHTFVPSSSIGLCLSSSPISFHATHHDFYQGQLT